MTKDNALIHFHADGSVSVYFPPLGTGGGKAMPTNIDWDLVREALEYDLDALYVLLDSCRLSDIYVALRVIRKRKLHDLLPRIYEMALDDEDLCLRAEAIRTIHAIGGRKTKEMLNILRSSEDRELFEELDNE